MGQERLAQHFVNLCSALAGALQPLGNETGAYPSAVGI